MVKKNLEIHSQNILPIIKKWLYSDKDIFLRELVSNSCDAIKKMEVLASEQAVVFDSTSGRIDIEIDKQGRTLKIADNGLGMSAEEVQKYIAQIAFSGAEEFLERYQKTEEKETFIGHFGLGFYSAYMVADKVEIDTLSYKEGSSAVFWSCDGSCEYLLETGKRTARGTTITLTIAEGNDEFLDPAKIRQLLHRFCDFFPYAIYFEGQKINTHDPLWIKNPAECTKDEYLAFYRHLYPMEEAPLFWIHLNVDFPFHLKGILFFPKLKRDFDSSKSSVQLYCNRVFVSDSCKDVIPNYLMMLRGIIDSPDIPLNVSRSYLQMDKTVRQLSSHISKKVADHLLQLFKTDKTAFLNIYEDISLVIKLGALEDDKFYERIKECLVWKTTENQWLTAEQYLEQTKELTKNKIFYTRDPKDSAVFLQMYLEKKIPVFCSSHPIDTYLMNTLEKKLSPATFQRIDAAVEEHLLDKEKEKSILDPSGKTEAAHLADFVRSKLSSDAIAVEAKSLASKELPGILVIGEQERRFRDYMQALDPKAEPQNFKELAKGTFVVNTNHPLMSQLQKLSHTHPELAKDLVEQTYELALLSQREMDSEGLNQFIHLSHKVLEQVVSLALTKQVIV